VDPWLVGDLQFFEQGWLYTGKKRGFGSRSGVNIDVQEVAADTDVILISQVMSNAVCQTPTRLHSCLQVWWQLQQLQQQ